MRNYSSIVFLLIFSFGFITNGYGSEISNQPAELTYQQRELLSKLKADIDAENKLTEVCQLVGDDKLEQAMSVLREIEWWETSIKINVKGINDESNRQMISYFQRYSQHDEDSCRKYSRSFILDSNN